MSEQEEKQERDFSQVAQATAAKEAEAYELFSERYDREFPVPEQVAVRLMNAVGWQFISIVIQSVFAIVLAALRTADMFFQAAAGTSTTVQRAEAITAVGAIELGIVIFATIKSEIENSKAEVNADNLKSALKIDTNLLRTGIITCVFISIVAGLGVSFEGFQIDWIGFKWILAIVMGIGASIVAWVSGDILGAILARWNNAVALATALHAKDVEARNERKRSMWEAAPERQIARSELIELKEYIKSNRPSKPKAAPQPEPAPIPQPRKTSTRSNEIRMKIYNYLDGDWDAHHDITLIPGPTKLANDLGVAKGYASDVIKEWKSYRNIPTSESDPNAAQ